MTATPDPRPALSPSPRPRPARRRHEAGIGLVEVLVAALVAALGIVGIALMLGTAGLPHIIVRFYTVRRVRDARSSAGWALLFIAVLYTTAPAVAVFARVNLLNTVADRPYAELPAWFSEQTYQLDPVHDDSPFFWHFARFRDVFRGPAEHGVIFDPEDTIAEQMTIVFLVLASVLSALLLLLPLVSIRSAFREMPHKGAAAIYFASLGLGFMFLEIALIQKLTLLLGYPAIMVVLPILNPNLPYDAAKDFAPVAHFGTAANVHFAVACGNYKVLEHFNDFADPWVQDLVEGAPRVDPADGCFALPTAPGLGVRLGR